MAITTITPSQMSYNTGAVITQGAGTAINASNTMIFAYPRQGKLLITIDSDHADTAATFTASDVFTAGGKGSLTVAVGDTVQQMVIVESDRLKQSDGTLEISWAANSAGYVRAFYLP